MPKTELKLRYIPPAKPDTVDRFGRIRVHTAKYYRQQAQASKTKRKEEQLMKIADGLDILRDRRLAERIKEKHKMAIALLTDFFHEYSVEQICAVIGVNPVTLRKWRQNPEFIKLLDEEITRKKTVMRLEAYKTVFKKIRKGDGKMTLAYLKMTGDLEENVNLKVKALEQMDTDELDKEIEQLEARLHESPGSN